MTNAVRESTAASASRSTYDRRWLILAVVLAAECMDLLDATVVNVAAPAIRHDFAVSASGLQWIVGGYSFAQAVGLITGGRLGDLFGRRRLFLIGAAGFTVCSLLCGLATDSAMLIAARLLQGLAAAVLLPQGFGILREVFPPEEQSAAFGLFGPVIGGAAVIGPVLGGALVGWDLFGSSWRLVFFVNLPVGILAIVSAWRLLPRSAPERRAQLDLLGTVLSGLACLALVYPLTQGESAGWPAWTYASIVCSVALFAAFGWQQVARHRRGADPLMVPSIFTHRGYAAGSLVLLVFFAGMSGLLLTVSVFLQIGHGFSAVHAGVTFIPMSLGLAAGAGLSGAVLGPRFGRTTIQAGALVALAGWLLVIVAVHGHQDVGAIDLLPGLAVAGFGMGLVTAPLFDIVLASVTEQETGSAAGVLNAVQQLAGALGVAVLGTVFFAAVAHNGDFQVALERTLWIQVGSLVACAVLSWLMPRRAREEPLSPG
jgi:EmrB/QacA subfamily drug resistance transporter